MNLQNPTEVFLSDCHYTRTTVEAALMYVAPTLQKNTASASTDHDKLVAPVICRATKFDWRKLSTCIPHLDTKSVPRFKRHLFGRQDTSESQVTTSSSQVNTQPSHISTQSSQVYPTPSGIHAPIAHRTRSQTTPSLPTESPDIT